MDANGERSEEDALACRKCGAPLEPCEGTPLSPLPPSLVCNVCRAAVADAATARKQERAAERKQRRAVACAAAPGTRVTLAENFRNISTDIKYEAGISGVIVDAKVFEDDHNLSLRCVKFDDVSILVPCRLLQCNTDGSADIDTTTDGSADIDTTPAPVDTTAMPAEAVKPESNVGDRTPGQSDGG